MSESDDMTEIRLMYAPEGLRFTEITPPAAPTDRSAEAEEVRDALMSRAGEAAWQWRFGLMAEEFVASAGDEVERLRRSDVVRSAVSLTPGDFLPADDRYVGIKHARQTLRSLMSLRRTRSSLDDRIDEVQRRLPEPLPSVDEPTEAFISRGVSRSLSRE